MRSAFFSWLSVVIGIATLTGRASADAAAVIYASSGSCIASRFGFDSKLQPVNPGVAWRITFNTLGTADASGKITEAGQSVDSASFGSGPRMHAPAANAFKEVFNYSVTGPNSDGSFSFSVGKLTGTFTDGPHAGLNFTISGFDLRKWPTGNGFNIYGANGSPVIQTVELSNGTHFQRICTGMILSAPPLQ